MDKNQDQQQLETLKKNILRVALAQEKLDEKTGGSDFSRGVYRAIDEILKNTGVTIGTLKKEHGM